MRRGDYGFDAPYALLAFLAGGIACVMFAGVAWWRHAAGAIAPLSLYAAFFLANAGSFLYTTRRGKFEEWDRILDGLSLSGTERVLDMGCGRGAVLTAVARRLTTGRVTGIDIWNTSDQSGNARDVTLRNASLEGVGDRVAIETGDMRALPFADASFDLVVSSLAIHTTSARPPIAERRWPRPIGSWRRAAGSSSRTSGPRESTRASCATAAPHRCSVAGSAGASGGATRSPPRPC